MLKFRTKEEVLKEWDDMIARVKAGEVSLNKAEAFKQKKGSSCYGKGRRAWGENERRSTLALAVTMNSYVRMKWERAMDKRQSWGVAAPDDDEKERIYRTWVRLGRITKNTLMEVRGREKMLDDAIAERRGFEAGAAKGNERALTLTDEMAEMNKRHKERVKELKAWHKKELDYLKARQKEELRQLQEKYEPWWERYKVRSRVKAELQGEFAWLYQRVTNDENSVRAWGKDEGLTFDALRSTILAALWNKIPESRRKGVWMSDDGAFSYDSLKRHYREHLEDFKPAPVKNPGHFKPEPDDAPESDGDQ